jgi:hypothetical protein
MPGGWRLVEPSRVNPPLGTGGTDTATMTMGLA